MTAAVPRLLIVGPPGAGKGTQAGRIAAAFGIPAISTGDIFRANIAEQTELGRQVDAIVKAGDYVPDSLTNALIADRLGQPDAHDGFLLDGYPRTGDQVAYLDGLLAERGQSLDVVLRLTADEDELVRRLLKRAAAQGRTDDTEETIRHRQALYRHETEPLVAEFGSRGLLVEVDGLGGVDEVTNRVFAALASHGIIAPQTDEAVS
jgi:adenylate kinase